VQVRLGDWEIGRLGDWEIGREKNNLKEIATLQSRFYIQTNVLFHFIFSLSLPGCKFSNPRAL
jgi:hypothetical protein